MNKLNFQIKLGKWVLGILLFFWAYIAIEPFLFAFFGWGWFWEYNPEFVPIFNQ